MASDYTFRGIWQTDENSAIQGGIDIGHESGFYLGRWASNINFDSDTSTEQDFYVGYAFDVLDAVSINLSVIHYRYEGDAGFSYQEYVVGVSVYDLGLSFVYSPEYFGGNGDGPDGPDFITWRRIIMAMMRPASINQ